jgi:hypothetical protein
MFDKRYVITDIEIKEFFFEELLERGYVPTDEEVRDIADIMFDFLVEKSVITDTIDYIEADDEEDDPFYY